MPKKRKQLKKPVAAKVNKDAKPQQIEPKIETDEEYRCVTCGHKYKKQEGNFNSSKSPLYRGNNGYISICRKCIDHLYDQYIDFFDKDEDLAMERMCQIMDMYFDDTAWDASRKTGRSRLSSYISKLNLGQSARGRTYSDTLIDRWEAEEFAMEEEAEKQASMESDDVAPEEVKRRFGVGFESPDYLAMQSEYDSWLDKCGEPMDKRQEELYVIMCYLKLNLQKGLKSDTANIGTLANAYKSFIEAATTEIEDRKKKAEAEMELKPIGVLFRDIEQYCPAEYYKDKKLYGDFDHLREYINRFMTRPLRNLLTGSKELDKEFNLSDSEE